MSERDEYDDRLRAVFAQAPSPPSPDLTSVVQGRIQGQRRTRRILGAAMAAAIAGVVVVGIAEVKYELIAPGALDPIYARLPKSWQPGTYLARLEMKEDPEPQPEPTKPDPQKQGNPLPILAAMTAEGPVARLETLKHEQDQWAKVILDFTEDK